MHIGPPASAAQSAIDHCRTIAAFSDEPESTTRTFLGPAMRACLTYFTAWAQRIGMSEVRVDAAGNFRAVLPGKREKRLIIASHLDSVPHAGAFDGVLGVVLGMAIAESFQGAQPACTLEIVGFSEEEGVRFSRPFIGSIGFTDGLHDELLSLTDEAGISVRQAISEFGLDVSAAAKPRMHPADAYLEFHIEQGPVLESLGLPLGIVDAIAGQTRAAIEFTGQANHAGTTPMNLRHDAFCAAAEWALLVEKTPASHPGLVATVGSVRVSPDASNIVPGRAILSLDLRHSRDKVRLEAFDALLEAGNQIARRRQVEFTYSVRLNQKAVPMNGDLISRIRQAVVTSGLEPHCLTSGAGHDAMILAKHLPCAMLFLRSPGGISHHPDENVLLEDVEKAITVGRAFVENFRMMQPQQMGSSRTSLKRDHLLHTPDAFVRAPLPGMEKATAIIHAGPALGARFTEYTAEMEAGGRLGLTFAERFFYVVSGQVEIETGLLEAGCYGFFPQGHAHQVTALSAARLLVIEKPYQAIANMSCKALYGSTQNVKAQPLMGDEGVLVQALLPDAPEFDFAVNLMTFAPGASLCMVEMHIMEHGLMMLAGGGVYRLGDSWYPVMAGDFIWMAPYCPQWFGAIGKTPAQYLIYKDWNRHPL